MTAPKKAYRLKEAADLASVSVGYLRSAIKSTNESTVPHLKAKFVGGSTGYLVRDADLDDFISRIQDA